jgi:hypothetical protein
MEKPSITRREIFMEQLERLETAAKDARRRIDFDSAHDIEILSAIDIVEDYLRSSGRVCYGGAAMNAQLPDKYKFYDPKYTIPDYDFLTPNPEGDITALNRRFRAAGFTEIGIRPGMHEGTTKIYINYTAVADISAIDPRLYKMFKEHAVKVRGITFMDVNSLRMMMYLELSRPRGEVERWSKVYERLLLLNTVLPPKLCSPTKRSRIPLPIYRSVLRYAIRKERVIAGASVVSAYRESLRKPLKAEWLFTEAMPLIVYAPDTDIEEIEGLKDILGPVRVKRFLGSGDTVPAMTMVEYYGWPLILYVQESACHAYNTLTMKDGEFVKIATLDTLISLYLSMMISGRKQLKKFFPQSILCIANECIELNSYMRRYPEKSQFPFISLTCSGYQKGLPTLLREKVARIQAEKRKTRRR